LQKFIEMQLHAANSGLHHPPIGMLEGGGERRIHFAGPRSGSTWAGGSPPPQGMVYQRWATRLAGDEMQCGRLFPRVKSSKYSKRYFFFWCSYGDEHHGGSRQMSNIQRWLFVVVWKRKLAIFVVDTVVAGV
jgi:hypothetical protein